MSGLAVDLRVLKVVSVALHHVKFLPQAWVFGKRSTAVVHLASIYQILDSLYEIYRIRARVGEDEIAITNASTLWRRQRTVLISIIDDSFVLLVATVGQRRDLR
jgi:hypothetical protein